MVTVITLTWNVEVESGTNSTVSLTSKEQWTIEGVRGRTSVSRICDSPLRVSSIKTPTIAIEMQDCTSCRLIGAGAGLGAGTYILYHHRHQSRRIQAAPNFRLGARFGSVLMQGIGWGEDQSLIFWIFAGRS